MSKIVIDVSSYQDSTQSFFQNLYKNGARGLMVKLTEGTNYLNPKAGAQVSNGLKVFGAVGVYHFFHGAATAEANYFLKQVQAFGLDKTTVLAIDVEASDLPTSTTSSVNAFIAILKKNGYEHVITYTSSSWLQSKRVDYNLLADKHIWVASYGVDQPGVDHANAWQFTDNFYGVDASYDFDGSLMGTSTSSPSPSESDSYWGKAGLYQVKSKMVWGYQDKAFKQSKHTRWAKGSQFYAVPVKYGDIYRLKTLVGSDKAQEAYVTANKDFVEYKG
ncbi:GH25 family lysozyme [Levilactobacillus bambusae]|uniref:Autolysin n=1 Tax=Levilactobacillus bambusae TaxID=2024736 RepID=A0A2V1N525_9LACO|nr:GH25 family lysozyme [Levilactobacillus bambusae]PWG00946.1 autolysin [Levilactobacillus bambusae]